MPKVTVLMPVYNGETHLREAIDSILNQTFTDFEFLIINDGSSDGSVGIIESYNDPRIRLVNNETNLKLISTLNKGIELATGEYIARMDCDDISDVRRLEIQVAVMDKDPNIAICGTGVRIIGKKLKRPWSVTGEGDKIKNCLYVRSCMIHPSVMMRSSVIKAEEFFYNKEYIHAEDYEFFQRLSEKYNIVNIKEPLLNYRWSPTSVSSVYSNEQELMTARISTEALGRLGITFNRIPYASSVLNKKQILTAKIELEEQYKKISKKNNNIEEVFHLLWLDIVRRGTHHGIWLIQTFRGFKPLKWKYVDKDFVSRVFLKSMLKKIQIRIVKSS